MAILDVENLLEPVSEENPCGPNLEYDDLFVAFENAARGKSEQQYGDTIIAAEEPDWREVRRLGLELVPRTKDLRVGCLLARGLLETDGIPAFTEALALIRGYVERYWQFVHPQLDPDDDNDPTLRMNTISSLSDPATTVKSLRILPIVSARAVGRFSLRDISIANGEMPPVLDEEPPRSSTIEAAFMECELDQLKSRAADLRDCVEHVESIETTVTNQVGASRAVSLESLLETLRELQSVIHKYLSRRDVGMDDALQVGQNDSLNLSPGQVLPASRDGEFRSREDVVTALDRICQYYDRWEPSSPIPLLLRRAKRLASKSFLEIVKDLSPSAVDQIQALSGPEHDESD